MNKVIRIFQPINNQVRDHEYSSIVSKLGEGSWEVEQIDVCTHDLLPVEEYLKDALALIVGGSPYSMVDDEHIPVQKEFLRQLFHGARDRQIPTLGICFGHQALAAAFGGQVVQDVQRKEQGFTRVYKTVQGREDPVFGFLPDEFVVRAHHEDHVIRLPEGAVHLLYNQVSEFQGFRLGDAPLYGVQFHPEVNLADVVYRYTHFHDSYFLSTDERDHALQGLIAPDDCAAELLTRFIAYARDCVLSQRC